jgi:hypothetical protein
MKNRNKTLSTLFSGGLILVNDWAYRHASVILCKLVNLSYNLAEVITPETKEGIAARYRVSVAHSIACL